MATRLYVTPWAPGSNLFGSPLGAWTAGDSTRDNRGRGSFIFRLAQTNAHGGVQQDTNNSPFSEVITAANNQKILAWRWVSDPLGAPVTISGTLTWTIFTWLTTAIGMGRTAQGQLHAYVTIGDSLIQRAVLVNNATDAASWTGTHTWLSMVFACASVAAQAGDRIVVEFGANCSPGIDLSNQFNIGYGTTDPTDAPYADATNGSVAHGAAWCEFSTTLTFAADPAPPANSSCATATVIPSLPYVSPRINTTTSTDTDRAVWFVWTADANRNMFAPTWGGNYATQVQIYTGTCGALVFVAGSLSALLPWLGTSQSVSEWTAVAGTTYYIKVTNVPLGVVNTGLAPNYTAVNSGGSLVLSLYPRLAPAYGDLFVDCQYIVCLREGVPINEQAQFYNLTPTGNAIDYSLRPLADLNGGTNTDPRLYVGLFGADPDVEILDLLTLNYNQGEIDFVISPIDTAPHSQNISSVNLDVNGNLIVGYFGDKYSVPGRLSTPAACNITRIDATHADNQPGAPFPVAARFTVAQENSGSDYLDITLDGSTAFYTSAGVEILRYNLNTSTQLPVFGTIPVAPGPRPGARGLKLFPPQDGSAGLLVAAGTVVYRLNGSGVVIQTYTPTDPTVAQDLDKIDFTPDATAFWVSDQYSTHLFKFDVTSGVQLESVDTGLPPGQLCGFSVYGSRKTPLPPPPPPGVPGCTVAFPVGLVPEI